MTTHQKMIALFAGMKILLICGDENEDQSTKVYDRLQVEIPDAVEGEETLEPMKQFRAQMNKPEFEDLSDDKAIDLLNHHLKEWCLEEEVNVAMAAFAKKPS